MVKRRLIERGDIYVVTLDPTLGSEERGRRHALVLSTSDYNTTLGRCLVAPISQGGNFARYGGYAVTLMGTGTQTQGVVLLTDVRVVDLSARKADFIERAPDYLIEDAIARFRTILD